MSMGGQTLKLVKKSVVTTKVATNTSMISKGIVGTFLALGLFSSTLSAKSGLFVGIDLGLQMTLASHHRIEVGVKIPLNKQKVERISVSNAPQAPVSNSTIKTLYAYQLASVGLSYAFVF